MNTEYNPLTVCSACSNEPAVLLKRYLTIMLLVGLAWAVSMTFAQAAAPDEPLESLRTKEMQPGVIICEIYQVDKNNQMKIVRIGEDCDGLMWLMAKSGKSA